MWSRNFIQLLVLVELFEASVSVENTSLAGLGDNDDCISEWLTCSVSDDNARPCCPGLYCWVQSEYYAQCQEVDAGVPTPMPVAQTPPTPPKPTPPSAYPCGASVDDTAYVNTEYLKWRNAYVIETGFGLCVDQPDQGSKCVSEGLGYGLILAAACDDQDTFDGLWKFAQYSFNENGLPNWEMSPTGDIWGEGSATDADMDIGLALLMAADKWDNSTYTEEAVTFIKNIMENDVDLSLMMIKPGDSWGDDAPYNPSYFSPAHMTLFEQATGDSRWTTVVENGYSFLIDDCATYTLTNSGLVPDWSDSLSSCSPGNANVYDMDNGADYYYDAIRTPWRLSLHSSWHCDTRALSWTANMASFFDDKGIEGIQQGFRMDGSSLGGGDSLCFISMSATTMLPNMEYTVINNWYSATQNTTSGGGLYFCDTLRMLSLTYQTGMMSLPDV
jgi:endo-1,4-beta-D-glucanase Y